MSQLAGKYVLEKQDNFAEYLQKLGVPEENIKAAQDGFTTLEIKVEGNDYTVTSAFGTRTFPLGKEIDETVGPGVLKSTASVDGNKLIINAKGDDGKLSKRIYEASASGLTVSMSTDGVETVGKLIFNRA